jgi:hypothetical protein
VATCVAVVTAGMTSASAGNGKTGDSSSSSGGGDGTTYTVSVQYTHRGEGGSPASVKYSGPFTPPVCWYTAMTPDQMRQEINRRYTQAGHDNASTVYNFYNDQNNEMENDGHYHEGKDGSWWVLTWDQHQLDSGNAACPYDEGYFWRPPADPPAGRITPEILAQAAYGQMKLPSKGVTLSPAAQNQKVNLPTYVAFTQAAAQVSVTAQVTEPDGTVVAATVVAVPSSLHVDAGTEYATPGACDYTMTGGQLNSAGGGCNITYTRASHGTYPFTADMTWKVSWTPTAEPELNGTPIQPDGFSESRQDVTVQEIQAVNR